MPPPAKAAPADTLESSVDFQREKTFLLYASFCGDAERTAFAAGMSLDEVLAEAREGKWDEKLRGILELRKSAKPGDVERAINRALNFVQAHRMRLILETMVQRIVAMTPEEFRDATTVRQVYLIDGEKREMHEILSTRPLADLTAALEKCHALTYAALGDTAAERKGRAEAPDEAGSGDLHARIAAAFAKPASPPP